MDNSPRSQEIVFALGIRIVNFMLQVQCEELRGDVSSHEFPGTGMFPCEMNGSHRRTEANDRLNRTMEAAWTDLKMIAKAITWRQKMLLPYEETQTSR